jgi:predicted nuclease of predicted toxin-antitoxin system
MLKFIADVNIEKLIVDYLKENGYDVKWIPDYNCEILDEDLLKLANLEKRILITNDKDFGELTFLQKSLSTGIILLRVKGQRAEDKVKLIEPLAKVIKWGYFLRFIRLLFCYNFDIYITT